MRIVLASASPRRLELLASLGLDVDVVPSGYEEPASEGLSPRDLAISHAREKCDAVRRRAGESDPVVAADTVVDVDGRAFGKPASPQEACAMLAALSGRTHAVHTAFAIAHRSNIIVECQTTAVTFFALSPEEIEAYVATGETMDKAGAYGIQGHGATLVERIDGDFYTVMGLPLGRLARALRRLGIPLPPAKTMPPTTTLTAVE